MRRHRITFISGQSSDSRRFISYNLRSRMSNIGKRIILAVAHKMLRRTLAVLPDSEPHIDTGIDY